MLRKLFKLLRLPWSLHDTDNYNDDIVSNEVLLNDYEKSPLRFEMEIVLEEFRSLRSEILLHSSNEQQVLNFAIALIAATLALLQFEQRIDLLLPAELNLRVILLTISILFSALGLMYIEQDAEMAIIGKYISLYLRPKLEGIIQKATGNESKIFQWDEFRGLFSFRSMRIIPFLVMSLSRYALTIIPSLFLLIYYKNLEQNASNTLTWENSYFFVALAISIIAILIGIYNGMLYLFISQDNVSSDNSRKLNFSKFLTAGYFIPILTLLVGFLPLVILSNNLGALWLNSEYDFPLVMIPSVLIGDSIFLPYFNYKFYLLVKSKSTKDLLYKNKTTIILTMFLSLVVSYVVNRYINVLWTSDNYLGFMDIQKGMLSAAGIYHFWFGVVQLALVSIFVAVAVLLYLQRDITGFYSAIDIWKIIVWFSSLTIMDFLVRQIFIYRTDNLAKALINDFGSFATLILSASILFIANRMKKQLH